VQLSEKEWKKRKAKYAHAELFTKKILIFILKKFSLPILLKP